MGDLSGHNLGPYRILEQAGAGGMATVYKAYHAAMDRYVAIKVLPQHLARDPNFRARFQREARTIARLEHRYILPVHNVGEEDGIPYLVMRYTDSGDLGDLIAKRSLTIPRAGLIVGQVAEALAYAHRQGIIHRDVKPANVLISRDGDALLSDFGIAKIYEETLQLTGEGMMVGTPTYMAPEQLQGQPVDARTDIYALGVVLYQSLTGEPPFIAETPLAVALMHIHNPLRPPREGNPAIPESLERIILRALAKNPNDRFQTADEMAEALRDALASMSKPTAVIPAPDEKPAADNTPLIRPAPPNQKTRPSVGARRPAIWLGVGAVVIAMLLLAVFLARSGMLGVSGQAGPAATSPAANAATTTAPATGPTLTSRPNLSVFSNTTGANSLAALGDAIWAATNGGLVRYSADGKPRAFTVADGLPFNATSAIITSPDDGTLWIGSYNRVAHVRPAADGLGEVKVYEDNLDIGDMHTFMIDSDKSIWVGGAYGARRFDGQKWAQPDLPVDDPAVKDIQPDVRALLRSSDNVLWIGLADGLVRWDGARWTVFSDAQGVGKAPISRLLQDKNGTIWAAAGGQGLLRYDAGKGIWQRVVVINDGEDILSIAQLSDGRLWVSGADGIASSADGGAHWAAIKAPEQYAGWAGAGVVAQDAAGRIWVGAGAGVSCCAEGQWRDIAHQAALPFIQVGKLAPAPDGKLWAIEQYGGAVATIDPATLKVEPFTGLDARIYAVAFTKDTLWLGSSAGVVRQRAGATLRLTSADGLPSDEIHELLATDTTIWIGTTKGLASYDLATEKIATVKEFDGGIIEKLLRAPDGSIWVGSIKVDNAGLVALGRYDGKTWQVWREGDPPLPEQSGGVTALNYDAQGHIWVGVWSGGVHTWDGATWKNWTDADGAPQGNVLALVPRDDEIWVAGQEADL
ncbi:MAG TPA: protein kinase, partial [Roseiflexaceae bacterium]